MANNKNDFKPRKRTNPQEKMINAILIILVLVFVVLSGVALYKPVSEKINAAREEQRLQEEQEAQQAEQQARQEKLSKTVKDAAAEAGKTNEEFISEYGLPAETTEETTMSELIENMTLDNYAKYMGINVDEYKSDYGLGDDVTGDMTMTAVQDVTPIGKALGIDEENWDSFKATYGLDDTIQIDTPYKDAWPVIQQKLIEQQLQQQAAEENTAGEGETAEDGAEPAAENTDADATAEDTE